MLLSPNVYKLATNTVLTLCLKLNCANSRDLARNTELGVQMSALGCQRRPSTRQSWVVCTLKVCVGGVQGGFPPHWGPGLGDLPQENFKNTGLPGAF